jgi:hypothetical protein
MIRLGDGADSSGAVGGLAGTVRGQRWRGGSSSERRKSCRSRRPPEVMVRLRQPREARSRTAQTRVRQLVSPGSRPMTLTLLRVSPKVRSMIVLSHRDDHAFELVFLCGRQCCRGTLGAGSDGPGRFLPLRRVAAASLVREIAIGSQRFGEGRPQALVVLLQFAHARVGFGEAAAQGRVANALAFRDRPGRSLAAARSEPLDLGADCGLGVEPGPGHVGLPRHCVEVDCDGSAVHATQRSSRAPAGVLGAAACRR